MYLRRAQGILRLKKRYSERDLEQTCAIMMNIGIQFPKLRDVEAIIKNKDTFAKYNSSPPTINRGKNPNLRGQQVWKSHSTKGVIS